MIRFEEQKVKGVGQLKELLLRNLLLPPEQIGDRCQSLIPRALRDPNMRLNRTNPSVCLGLVRCPQLELPIISVEL